MTLISSWYNNTMYITFLTYTMLRTNQQSNNNYNNLAAIKPTKCNATGQMPDDNKVSKETSKKKKLYNYNL